MLPALRRMDLKKLLLLALVGGCIDAPIDETETATTTSNLDQTPVGTSPVTVQTVTTGTGWRRLAISGSLYDPASATLQPVTARQLVVVDDPAQLAATPLPPSVRAALEQRTNAALAAGKDAPVWIVDETTAQQVEDYAKSGSKSANLTGCSDWVKTYAQDLSDGASKSADLTNLGFSGTAGKFEVGATFGIRSEETLSVFRDDTPFGCVPVGASLDRVALTGWAEASAHFTLDGSPNGSTTGRWKKQLGKVELAPIGFWIGPLPVVLRVSVPFEVGIDATNAGTNDIDITFAENLSAGVSCSLDGTGCTTSSTATHEFTSNKTPDGSTNIRGSLTPWARASLRIGLYDDSLAYAQLGLRPRVNGDFWYYSGSSCGDGDGNGTNEYVRALTLDASVGLDASGTVAIANREVWEHNWPLVSDLHVGFWDLYPGGSSALKPIFYDTAVTTSITGKPTLTMTGRMRPCWPYGDTMTFRLDWADGTTTSLHKVPSSSWTSSHSYTYGGNYTLKLTASQDTAGRRLNKMTTHAVSLPGLLPPVLN